ncbi:MAG: GGDEF domain-containing protein [Coriobacteriales bacterium]|jgi:diguanylate cyclase (GGDEF)-like protein|nr:GGDEF domain-containing protein [Coriobacteriales bacterium]
MATRTTEYRDAGKIRQGQNVQVGSLHLGTLVAVGILLALLLAVTIFLTVDNNSKLNGIIEESVQSELLAICFAAREDIDMDLFLSIDNEEDIQAQRGRFDEEIAQLRELKDGVGATYIYALKEIDGAYYFIFDTDEEAGTPDNPIFDAYEIAPVHEQAFAGEPSADLMNVEDEWGSYNTGAIPLYHEGKIVGIVSTDVEDAYIERGRQTATFDMFLLISITTGSIVALMVTLVLLLRRNRRMQESLFFVANHDAVTGLLNRYYLFSYLSKWDKAHPNSEAKFASLFIDLDNFKVVNDCAGHDAGDEVLQLIADFLKRYTDADPSDGPVENLTTRIGGDEFVQLIPGIATPTQLEERARTMLADFSAAPELQPFIQDYGIGLSIGGALFPAQATDHSELLRLADIAMYEAKHGGKGNYFLYDESMGNGPDGALLAVRTAPR